MKTQTLQRNNYSSEVNLFLFKASSDFYVESAGPYIPIQIPIFRPVHNLNIFAYFFLRELVPSKAYQSKDPLCLRTGHGKLLK